MENKETTTGQAVQCKKTDWFKKIYGDMIGDEELRSITLPDGTRLELNSEWLGAYLSDIRVAPRRSTSSTRLTTMEDELIERIFVSGNSSEATDVF